MAKIDSGSKSSRLLASRRYTHDTFTTAQESFTNVLDLRSEEIYTQAGSIPSSGLPFSGSSQSGETSGVLKYYFRQRLTRSNVANDVFFFMVPTGSTGGVTPQLIQDGQQGSFISPKYSVSSLANANTEDTTPGYGVKVFKSTSLDSGSLSGGDIVSVNDYQFDYKTGVIQFESALSSNLEVYMSAYQYVGKTLRTGLFVSGSINAESGSFTPAADDVIDLGSSTFQWKDLHLDGTANIDTLSLTDGFTYNGVTLNTSGSSSDHLEVTGSGFTFKGTDSSDLFTLVNNSNEISVQIDDKVIVLGESSTAPTAVKGGMFYSGSQWFLGYENSPT